MICGVEMLVLCGSVVSCDNLCCAIWIEGSTGTDVKRAFTSSDVMVSPGSSLTCLMCSTNCCVLLNDMLIDLPGGRCNEVDGGHCNE